MTAVSSIAFNNHRKTIPIPDPRNRQRRVAVKYIEVTIVSAANEKRAPPFALTAERLLHQPSRPRNSLWPDLRRNEQPGLDLYRACIAEKVPVTGLGPSEPRITRIVDGAFHHRSTLRSKPVKEHLEWGRE